MEYKKKTIFAFKVFKTTQITSFLMILASSRPKNRTIVIVFDFDISINISDAKAVLSTLTRPYLYKPNLDEW